MPIWYIQQPQLISNPYIDITSTTSTATTLISWYQPQTTTSTSAYNTIGFGGTGGLQHQLLLQGQINEYQQGLSPIMLGGLARHPGWTPPPMPAPPIIGEAINRARELLLSHLTPKQRETFEKKKWFIVEGGKSKREYRIRDAGHLVANIDVLDSAGYRMHGLCGHCAGADIPLYDSLLAQKLMLETSEDEFLKIANQHR